jgi:hypothetical protein
MKLKFVAAVIAAGLMASTGYAVAQAKADADKPEPPDPKVIETIFAAFAGGLPEKWDRAWIVVAEKRAEKGARDFYVECLFTVPGASSLGQPMPSCDRKTIFEEVWSLNKNIPSREQRRWTAATLVFTADGKFELNYDYEAAAEPTAEKKKKKKN